MTESEPAENYMTGMGRGKGRAGYNGLSGGLEDQHDSDSEPKQMPEQ